MEAAQKELAAAIESGDAQAQVEANKRIATLAFENAKLATAKEGKKLNKQHRQRNLYNSPMGQLKCHQNQHQIQEPKNGLQGIHGLVKTEL